MRVPGCSKFSVIDIMSAFLQLPLNESSRHITTFTTEDGLYRFKKVPFSFRVSTSGVFQKLMTITIGNIDGVFLIT